MDAMDADDGWRPPDMDLERSLTILALRLGLAPPTKIERVETQRDLGAIARTLAARGSLAVALVLDARTSHIGGVLLDARDEAVRKPTPSRCIF